jgi:uncharacterized membrane protein
MMMQNDTFLKYTLIVSLLATVITFFYVKLTGKDDRDLHKQVFRVFVLVFLSNTIVYYLLHNGKDKVLSEPFFN